MVKHYKENGEDRCYSQISYVDECPVCGSTYEVCEECGYIDVLDRKWDNAWKNKKESEK